MTLEFNFRIFIPESLQHALIPEAENVADSEDSEDEWNYYRIDPNKKESATGESIENVEEQKSVQSPESVPRDNSEEVQSSKVEEVDIKCEGSEIESLSSKLINIDVNINLHYFFSSENFCYSQFTCHTTGCFEKMDSISNLYFWIYEPSMNEIVTA